MRVLLTGAAGQLGRCFQERLPESWQLMATTSEQLDITDNAAVCSAIEQFQPQVIINAAAYTAVDKAESEPEKAHTINADAVGYLAAAAAKLGIPFVHVSTDYVFSGAASQPYQENASCSPQSVYGHSKLAGENIAFSVNPQTIVIRTAWVFSEHGNNFVKTMLRLGEQRDSLSIVDDQRGCPTYAGDIADAIIKLLKRPVITPGIYNYCGDEHVSWFEFARTVFTMANKTGLYSASPALLPITTAEFPTAASRPKYSVLCTDKIESLNIMPSRWASQLETVLLKLLS